MYGLVFAEIFNSVYMPGQTRSLFSGRITAASLIDDGVYTALYNGRNGQTHIARSWDTAVDGTLSQMPANAVPRRTGHHILRRRLGLMDETDLYGFAIKIEGRSATLVSTNSRSVNFRLHGDSNAADKVIEQINAYIKTLNN